MHGDSKSGTGEYPSSRPVATHDICRHFDTQSLPNVWLVSKLCSDIPPEMEPRMHTQMLIKLAAATFMMSLAVACGGDKDTDTDPATGTGTGTATGTATGTSTGSTDTYVTVD